MLAEKLLDVNDPRDLTVMRSALSENSGISGLVVAQKLLGTSSRKDAERAIGRALNDPNGQVRSFAATLAIADSALWPQLANKLDDSDSVTQVAALKAVANLHQTDRFNEIERYLSASAATVSLAAANALASLDVNKARGVFETNLTSGLGHLKTLSAAMLLILPQGGAASQSEGVKKGLEEIVH